MKMAKLFCQVKRSIDPTVDGGGQVESMRCDANILVLVSSYGEILNQKRI